MAKSKLPSNEVFVETLQKASSMKEACEKLGVSSVAISTKATALRKAGVKLKKFPSGRKSAPVNVDSLNTIITTVSAQKEQQV